MSARVLYKCVINGDAEEVEQFLTDNPAFDVNESLDVGWTALHFACYSGHHEVVSVLLVHPLINVNKKDDHGRTTLYLACYFGSLEIAKVLLDDPRSDINLPDHRGCTPLWWASYGGLVGVINWMIASGRELDLDREGKYGGLEYTAIEIAIGESNTAVVSLLERFIGDQEKTSYEVRVELGVHDALAVDLFAITVFICDDFLRIKQPQWISKAGRFFRIASRLPMELQMMLCHRAHGSAKDNIPSKDSEPAFKSLAKLY